MAVVMFTDLNVFVETEIVQFTSHAYQNMHQDPGRIRVGPGSYPDLWSRGSGSYPDTTRLDPDPNG